MLKRRGISLFSLAVLLLSVMSWPLQSGLSFDNPRQIELSVKDTGDSNSALWVRNLSTRSAKLAVGVNSASVQELPQSLAGGAIMRLDESLPADLRGNDLLIRGDEQVAAIVAPAELQIDQSEFYYQQPVGNESFGAPKWVIELGVIGKSGENVLKANHSGYAPAIVEQPENAKRYLFGVGVALRRANSSAEVKLISKAGQVIKSLMLTGPASLNWRADLGEFTSGSDDFPARVEINALAGKAQGFLSIKDLETGETKVLPVAPMGKKRKGIQAMAGGPYGGGYAYFTSLVSCPFSPYSYVVYDAPPNTCGTLKLVRNGVFQSTPGWICTDANGGATRGPWSVSKTETVQSVRIEWPDGTRTYGGDTHIDDNTAPSVWINQSGGNGVPIPDKFGGGGSDPQWGSGIYSVYGTFLNASTGLYWNGSSYNSPTQQQHYGTLSPLSGGYNVTWSVAPPQPGAHNRYDTYVWCVKISDSCFTTSACIVFQGPRP
jgi:hypothetical protein